MMSIWGNIMDRARNGVRSWLNIEPANVTNITIRESLDYEGNAIKNRIWYRGDASELSELYQQINDGSVSRRFWASESTDGLEMRKVHTGLPALMVDTLAGITLSDFKISIESNATAELWEKIDKFNQFEKRMEKAVKETLYIGDGAFKISFDPEISQEYPIIEFYAGDRIELVQRRGQLREIIFRTYYHHDNKTYVLKEHYRKGEITYDLWVDGKQVDMSTLPQTEGLVDMIFGEDQAGEAYMLAVPVRFWESGKWEGRGQSIFDKKTDSFDSLDEAWSQWIDALRTGRAKTYIPESLIPRNPNTGELRSPNPFDDRFVTTSMNMSENGDNRIVVEQPQIPHDAYAATYSSALDLCLQGLISPATIGVDVKKLDNAEAQREKEKTTLYTRGTIVDALKEDVTLLVQTALNAYAEYRDSEKTKAEISVDFGDYANPSFEAKVETVAKGRAAGILSLEASIDELYGNDKEDEWKQQEVERLMHEQGLEEMEEPAVRTDAGDFHINVEEDEDESKGEPEGPESQS